MAKGRQLSCTPIGQNQKDVATFVRHPGDTVCPRRRSIHYVLALVILAFSSSASLAQTSFPTDSTLASIKSLFDAGSYISAELEARRALEDTRVSDSVRVQLQKLLGFALVAQGRNEAAIEHFIDALKLDSSLTLDPVLTSPKILNVFETAKEQYRNEIVREKKAGTVSLVKNGTVYRPPSFRAILFPGWDQIYRGRSTKGWVLLGLGAAAAVTAIASDILRREARTSYLEASTPVLAASRYSTYNAYYKTEFYSVSAFIVIYVYSEFDSFLRLPPHFGVGYSRYARSIELNFHTSF